ncbi:MAG: response regulator transcription factor [Reinekea forsetii]|jgi:two-component system OmpR family response regulator|uniref:DNA-binding protein response regulator GltR n=1 Tax=Reinekea forsetii TaxID=1336806 RepID=A0A2K8KSB1_9GAMM|nr:MULTISPECIES: response regulator transcription factor [Reinekea]ATX77608.1 DNA-binding protein response regulator GltR [Reinekea forsetii]MDO7641836.1 response regulator transcription factor [Reinekea forsetii]MDO7644747.1 response regulator transcription factor [Reinekea forsetii]MDO7673933.1 response regulator transcription factor [Reinekea forsetii]
MQKKIFVVDDDDKIRQLLQIYLEKNNYQVVSAADGESFLAQFNKIGKDISLVILDIMLPGMDGFAVCQSLRKISEVPIIMLTANAEETDLVVGLELGADDYIAKPFSPRELLARIKAIHRRLVDDRKPLNRLRYFYFKDFIVDRVERLLIDERGDMVKLSGGDFQLLQLFLENPGEVLSRDRISEQIRGRESGPTERYLDVQISRLRQRLGDDGKTPLLIKTMRGSGYVFATEVTTSDDSR